MTESRNSRPLVGILWMLLAGVMFVGVTALVKVLGDEMPAPQSAFIRYALGLVFILPVLPVLVRARPTRRQWGLFATRGFLHGLGVMCWFFAMTRIPIADVTAMNYLSPVYVTLGAAIFMGEKLAMRRIMAIVVALVGAAIILRPGFREISVGHYAMMANTIIFGASYLMAKKLADEASVIVVVSMLSFFVALSLLPAALLVWVPPTWEQLAILFGVASLATAGHYMMTIAFTHAPMAVTQPATFLQLVWAVLLGALVFNEGVDLFVVLGGTIILCAVMFISWREAVLNRRAITPAPNVTKS